MINHFKCYIYFILEIHNQSITNICYIGQRKNIKHFFKIFGNSWYKPDFGPYSSASDRPSFLQKIFGEGSVRLNRHEKYPAVIRMVS